MGETETELEDDQDPIQQSVEIHRRRIISILERMIEKLEVGICLDKLFTLESNLLTSIMPVQQYNSLIRMGHNMQQGSFATYSKSIASSTTSTRTKIRKIGSAEFSTSIMIAMLHHNPEVMKKVKTLLKTIPPGQKNFLDQMEDLKNYILEIIRTSAMAERAYCKQIGQSWIKNEKYKKRNLEMEKIHSDKMYELSFKINKKNKIIQNYKEDMEQRQEKCLTDLHRIVNESGRYMAKTTATNEENLVILTEEAKNITTKYQSLLESHLSHEKTLRTKRYKIETVLASWLTKFDADIGELQTQLEEQQNGYNKEKSDFDELTRNFEDQTIQYDELMTEKEEEEQRILDAKRAIFIRNRSARRIQRWWRVILSRRYGRKKKKGKGKKK